MNNQKVLPLITAIGLTMVLSKTQMDSVSVIRIIPVVTNMLIRLVALVIVISFMYDINLGKRVQ